MFGILRHRGSFIAKPGVAVTGGNAAGRRTGIVIHAGEIEGIDGWRPRPIAGSAVIAVDQRRTVGGDSGIGARVHARGHPLLRMKGRHCDNDSACQQQCGTGAA